MTSYYKNKQLCRHNGENHLRYVTKQPVTWSWQHEVQRRRSRSQKGQLALHQSQFEFGCANHGGATHTTEPHWQGMGRITQWSVVWYIYSIHFVHWLGWEGVLSIKNLTDRAAYTAEPHYQGMGIFEIQWSVVSHDAFFLKKLYLVINIFAKEPFLGPLNGMQGWDST